MDNVLLLGGVETALIICIALRYFLQADIVISHPRNSPTIVLMITLRGVSWCFWSLAL